MTIAASVLWTAFAALGLVVKAGWILSLDTRCILALRAALPGIESFMVGASWTAGNGAAPLAILIALVIGRRAGKRQGWMYAFACLGGWLANLLLKELFVVVRPGGISPKLTAAGWYSFPSGHAMMALLIFGFGALLLARTLRTHAARGALVAVGALLTLVVGLSRIYLGAHWPSDVLGGWLAGAGFAVVCLMLKDRADASAAGVPVKEPAV